MIVVYDYDEDDDDVAVVDDNDDVSYDSNVRDVDKE